MQRREPWWHGLGVAAFDGDQWLLLTPSGQPGPHRTPPDNALYVLTAGVLAGTGTLTVAAMTHERRHIQLAATLRNLGFWRGAAALLWPDGRTQPGCVAGGMSRSEAAAIGDQFEQRFVFELHDNRLLVIACAEAEPDGGRLPGDTRHTVHPTADRRGPWGTTNGRLFAP